MAVDITVIILTRNEERFIRGILNELLLNEGLVQEIIIADGLSTDNTLSIAAEFTTKLPLQIYHNTKVHVSQALNAIIPKAEGKYIAILGAHAVYPSSYLKTGVEFLESNPEYSMVGGPLVHQANTLIGKSIAACMSSKFGMGNTTFRTSWIDCDTDTVPFPIYKKEIFELTGPYDTSLIRNQDEDFNYRAVNKGIKIKMLKALQVNYFVRENYPGLIKQFYQYGYYKPIVSWKNNFALKIRHFVPASFVIYIVLLLLFNATNHHDWFMNIPLWIYFILLVGFSLTSWRNPILFFINLITYPLMHLSYGVGYLKGLAILMRSTKD